MGFQAIASSRASQSDIVSQHIYSASASLLPLSVSLLCQFSPPPWFPGTYGGNNRCTINVGQALESERLMCLLSGLLAGRRDAMFVRARAPLCVFFSALRSILAPGLLKFRP